MKKRHRQKSRYLWLMLIGIIGVYACSNLDIDQYRQAQSAKIPKPAETYVQFLGNTNLVFGDSESAVMLDGYFSYPVSAAWKFLYTKIEPNTENIERQIAKIVDPDQVVAVLPIHSHFDHALDVGPVAQRLERAVVFGSSSTQMIFEGWFDGQKNQESEAARRFRLIDSLPEGGRRALDIAGTNFKVTVIDADHANTPIGFCDKGSIDKPITGRTWMCKYKSDEAYNVLIEYIDDGKKEWSALVVGSAAAPKKGSLDGLEIDVLFLGVSGAFEKGSPAKYFDSTVRRLQPKTVVPVHWDSLYRLPSGDFHYQTGITEIGAKSRRAIAALCEYVSDMDTQVVFMPFADPIRFKQLETPQSEPLPKCPAK